MDKTNPPTPHAEWIAEVARRLLEIKANSVRLTQRVDRGRTNENLLERLGGFIRERLDDVEDFFRGQLETHESLMGDIKSGGIKGVFDELHNRSKHADKNRHIQSLEDLKAIYTDIRLPAISSVYTDDFFFARMRVAGPNPVMISRIDTVHPEFPITEMEYQSVMGTDDSLDAAIQEGRIYFEDLSFLEGLQCGTIPSGQKYLPAPMAMFAVPKHDSHDRNLRVVAIQCGPRPDTDTPLFTPHHGYSWQMAKSAFTVADGNVHQAVTHLAHTHLVVNAFVMATTRNLHRSHPVHVLLEPHFEGTLNINDAADDILCRPGGGVDSMLSGTIETSRTVASKAANDWSFNDSMLHKALEARGVDNAELLPHYPYRDDALLLWPAIHEWVTEYLALYYESDRDVVEDDEIQRWAQEIVRHEDGGRIKDFGEDGKGKLTTVKYLADALTHMIFTASAQHAAVNFPQYELMSWAPNYPLAAYGVPPTAPGGNSEKDYLDYLPMLNMLQYQMEMGYLLGSVHYTELGEYREEWFSADIGDDRRVKPLLRKFQLRLERIDEQIKGRNLRRSYYPYLRPKFIPQSINI